MASAIATAIIVAIRLDVVATAIGADKAGKETHGVTPFGWYGSNIPTSERKKKFFLFLFPFILPL
jgi:hypothetical protein